jgi:hypothetical protein
MPAPPRRWRLFDGDTRFIRTWVTRSFSKEVRLIPWEGVTVSKQRQNLVRDYLLNYHGAYKLFEQSRRPHVEGTDSVGDRGGEILVHVSFQQNPFLRARYTTR